MSEKRHRNRKKFKKEKLEMDSLIESDEHFRFIAGYTSNGVPYGLTHDEMDELRDDIKNKIPEKDNLELLF